MILVKVAMLQDLLLRAPFHDQAKELTLADLAKEQRLRVEKGQAGCVHDSCEGCHVAGLVVEGPFPRPGERIDFGGPCEGAKGGEGPGRMRT